MSKAAMNLQDSFLNQVRRENSEVQVLLVNGKALRGIVKGFDNFTVILSSRSGQHLIYKHAIAQLLSHRGMTVKREGDEGEVSETEEPAESSQPALQAAAQPRPSAAPKKEGFNTLDLSRIRLAESEQAKVSTQ